VTFRLFDGLPADAMQRRQRYRLIAWTVIPDHAHALIETVAGHGLESIVGSWKPDLSSSFSSPV